MELVKKESQEIVKPSQQPIEGKVSSEVAEVDDIGNAITIDKVYTDEKGEVILDENSLPKFKASLAIKVTNKELHFIWNVIKDLLELNIKEAEESFKRTKKYMFLIPREEVDSMLTLMEMVASYEKEGDKRSFYMTLPINYFVGMWKVHNLAREIKLYSQNFVAKNRELDELTMAMAKIIDSYHKVDKFEKTLDNEPFKEVTPPKAVAEIEDKT